MAEKKPTQSKRHIWLRPLGAYIKDLSFENIAAVKGGNAEKDLQLNVEIDIDGARGNDNRASVGMKINAEAKASDDPMFIIELEYIGIFIGEGLAPNSSGIPKSMLLIRGPEMLFPYAQRIVADISLSGGFPPVMLESVDFEKLYYERSADQDPAAEKEEKRPPGKRKTPPGVN
jgi:preprotein translocase subunit SecB